MSSISINSQVLQGVIEEMNLEMKQIQNNMYQMSRIRESKGFIGEGFAYTNKSIDNVSKKLQVRYRQIDIVTKTLIDIINQYYKCENSLIDYVGSNNSQGGNAAGEKTPENIEKNIGEMIRDFLNNREKDRYRIGFGKYMMYTMTYINSIGFLKASLFGVKNFGSFLKSAFTGGTKYADNLGDVFMNNPEECKKILRKAIDDISKTEYLDLIDDDSEGYLDTSAGLAAKIGYESVEELVGTFNGVVGGVEEIDKVLKNYAKNISHLNNIKNVYNESGFFSDTVDSLIKDYENQMAASLKESISNIGTELAEQGIEKLLGPSYAVIDKVLDVAYDANNLDSLETVIYTSSVKTGAMDAFEAAANKIASGDYNQKDVNSYLTSFELTKSLLLNEYDAMLAGTNEADKKQFLISEIEKIKAMTPYNF